MHKRLIIIGLVIVGLILGAILITEGLESPMPSQTGLKGHWTTQEKETAQKVLTSSPIRESRALAACVISKIDTQNDYSQFQQYAQMAALDNFDSPNIVQLAVISNLMSSALSCPEPN